MLPFSNRSTRCVRLLTSAVLSIAFIGSAAFFSPPAEAFAQQESTTTNPLAGPHVETDQPAPGVSMGFGDSNRQRFFGRSANVGLYGRLLKTMELPDDQQVEIRAVFVEYSDAVKAYFATFRGEMRGLRQVTKGKRPAETDRPDRKAKDNRPADQSKDKDEVNASDRKPTKESEKATARLREINRGKPQPEAYLIRVWEMLTPDQQVEFRGALEAMQQEREMEAMGMTDANGQPGEVRTFKNFAERRQAQFEAFMRKTEGTLTDEQLEKLQRLRERLGRERDQPNRDSKRRGKKRESDQLDVKRDRQTAPRGRDVTIDEKNDG